MSAGVARARRFDAVRSRVAVEEALGSQFFAHSTARWRTRAAAITKRTCKLRHGRRLRRRARRSRCAGAPEREKLPRTPRGSLVRRRMTACNHSA